MIHFFFEKKQVKQLILSPQFQFTHINPFKSLRGVIFVRSYKNGMSGGGGGERALVELLDFTRVGWRRYLQPEV